MQGVRLWINEEEMNLPRLMAEGFVGEKTPVLEEERKKVHPVDGL